MSIVTATLPTRQLPPLADTADWAALMPDQPVPAGAARELAAASAAVRRYCRWSISPVVTETVTLNGHGGTVLMLPTLRLVKVVSITETRRGRDELPVPVNLAEIEATEQGWLRRDRPWTNRLSGISVVMEHGYDAAEIPDVAAAVATMAIRGTANPTGIDTAVVGSVSIRYARQTDGVYMVVGGFDAYARQL